MSAAFSSMREGPFKGGFLKELIQEHIEQRALSVAKQACLLADIGKSMPFLSKSEFQVALRVSSGEIPHQPLFSTACRVRSGSPTAKSTRKAPQYA